MSTTKIPILISHQAFRRHYFTDVIYNHIKNKPNFNVHLVEPEHFSDAKFIESIVNKEDYKVLLMSNLAGKDAGTILKHFKNIKWMQAIGAGVENLLTVEEIVNNNELILTNLKSASALTLAEFALLGALYFTKEIPRYQKLALEGKWKKTDNLNIPTLEDKNALIIGLGSIGCEIAKKCYYGFNMNVIGVKRDPEDLSDDIKSIVKRVEKPEKIKELVKDADYIFVALPFQNNGYVVNQDIVQNMKKGVIFINVGRGNTVEEKALIEGIRTGIIKGAALDVFENEPLSKDSVFYTDPEIRDRVINTSHNMDQGENRVKKTVELVEENLRRYLNGEALLNIIDKKKGY